MHKLNYIGPDKQQQSLAETKKLTPVEVSKIEHFKEAVRMCVYDSTQLWIDFFLIVPYKCVIHCAL